MDQPVFLMVIITLAYVSMDILAEIVRLLLAQKINAKIAEHVKLTVQNTNAGALMVSAASFVKSPHALM